MSALGDYVHYNYQNYVKYGIARVNTQPKQIDTAAQYVNYKKKRLENLKEQVSDSTIAQLKRLYKENSLAAIKRDEGVIDENFKKKTQMLFNMMKNRVNSKWFGQYHGQNIQRGKGSGWVGGTAATGAMEWETNLTHGRKTSKSIMKQQKELMQLMEKLDSMSGFTSDKQLNKIAKKYEKISGHSFTSSGNLLSDFVQMQKDLDDIKFYTTWQEFVGDFGEYFFAMLDDRVSTLSQEEFERTINQFVVGKNRSNIVYDTKTGNLMFTKPLVGKSYEKDKVFYSLGSTQNKVDVDIVFNKDNLLATIKNWANSSKGEVTLQRENLNLALALAQLDYYDKLGTHWMNMHMMNKTHKQITYDSSLEEAVKFELAYEALVSGNPLKQSVDKANLFVSFDRMTGNVIIERTADLLENHLNLFSGLDKVASVKLYNKFQHIKNGGVSTRLYLLQETLHKKNYLVGLKTKYLTK